jgi:hypothetical protein
MIVLPPNSTFNPSTRAANDNKTAFIVQVYQLYSVITLSSLEKLLATNSLDFPPSLRFMINNRSVL